MKKLFTFILVASFVAIFTPAHAGVSTGEMAPNFEVIDSNGEMQTLSNYKGQPVILEWTNHDCPYVKKHYESNNMQRLQRDMTEKGYAWLSIISSAPGKQGFVDGQTANGLTASRGASPTAVLLDSSGEIGQMYGARTTPHMFIIDEKGMVVYAGAIDDKNSADKADVGIAKNYIRAAVANMEANEPIKTASTQPYGCSVKYGSAY